MEQSKPGFGRKLVGLATGISRLPSFLIGLLIIFLISAGAYAAWQFYANCDGKGTASCLLGAINPIPASYGRGAGEPMGCAADEELNGALCYPKCKSGYKGVGPVCWQNCPSGFRDDGTFCAKPASYGRGAGFPWKFGDATNDKGMFSRCEQKHGKGNCEKHLAIVYPKCRSGFNNAGCCVCSPICPGGMTDIGVSCTKKSYGRTAGKPLHACTSDQEKDGLLCYPKCKDGFKGVGPVCWEQKA